jgi:hypothetical protein
MSPDLKASPPVKGCPLFAVAALGMLGSLAGVIALGILAIRSAVS